MITVEKSASTPNFLDSAVGIVFVNENGDVVKPTTSQPAGS